MPKFSKSFCLGTITEIRAFQIDKWIQDNENCSSCLLIGRAEQTADRRPSFKTSGFVDGRENGSFSTNHISLKTRREERVWDLVVLKVKKCSSDLQSTVQSFKMWAGWRLIVAAKTWSVCVWWGTLICYKANHSREKTGPTFVVTCFICTTQHFSCMCVV